MVGRDPLASAVDPSRRAALGLAVGRVAVVAALLGRGVCDDGEVCVHLEELDVGEGILRQVVLLDRLHHLRPCLDAAAVHDDEVVGEHPREGVPVLRLDGVPDLPLLSLDVRLSRARGRRRRRGVGVRVGVRVSVPRPSVRVLRRGACGSRQQQRGQCEQSLHGRNSAERVIERLASYASSAEESRKRMKDEVKA